MGDDKLMISTEDLKALQRALGYQPVKLKPKEFQCFRTNDGKIEMCYSYLGPTLILTKPMPDLNIETLDSFDFIVSIDDVVELYPEGKDLKTLRTLYAKN